MVGNGLIGGCGRVWGLESGETISETHDLLTIRDYRKRVKELEAELARVKKELEASRFLVEKYTDLCTRQVKKIQGLQKEQRGKQQ